MVEETKGQDCESELVWYALRTRYQHEKMAAESLVNKRFVTFLPLYQAVRRWKDRTKRLSLPLFPGYLFVRGGLRRWRDVVTTPGIRGLVKVGDQAASVPEAEIEAIRRVVDSPMAAEPCPFIKCGDWVEVKVGPLAGLRGILVRKKNQFRLVLSIEMLGKAVAVEVDAMMVERLPAMNVAWAASRAPQNSILQVGRLVRE